MMHSQRFVLCLIYFSSALQVLVLAQQTRRNSILTSCRSEQLLCGDRHKCISPRDLCNFRDDCDDGSDEDQDLCRIYQQEQGSCQAGEVQSSYCHSNSYYDRSRSSNSCTDVIGACLSEDVCETNLVCEFLQFTKRIMLMPRKSGHRKDEEIEQCIKFPYTSPNKTEDDCPAHYTKCGTECLSLNISLSMTWESANGLCESISGSLKTFSDAEDLRSTGECLKNADTGSNYWIGGFFNRSSATDHQSYNYTPPGPPSYYHHTTPEPQVGTFVWIDGEEMPLGMPYWAIYSIADMQHGLRPLKYDDMCVSMKYEDFYYFSEDFCNARATPLCVFQQESEP